MLPTQAELLKEHRVQLDERFVRKYPIGKFCLQHRNDSLALCHGNAFFGLHWCPKRSTGAYKLKGISTYLRRNQLVQENYQNNCFGKCYNYDSLNKLLKACERHNVPIELVSAFKERYNNRMSEGFSK